ncbi:MAG TPA: chlorohydrolase [Methanosarcinaceae archaeon]|nr:chlorohydrolase [Methanosarcinaceae archaeon]
MSSSCEQIISGTIIIGTEFEHVEGYICVSNGIITEIGEESSDTGTIIAPCFVNSHTHIGDSICKDPSLGKYDGGRLIHDLDSLVRPPDGLKHRILRSTPYHALVESMRGTILDMITTGTCAFADFREGGVVGVLALKEAIGTLDMENLIFGRPDRPDAQIEDVLGEVNRVLRNADGLGISGVNDMDSGMIRKMVEYVRGQKHLFAIHAGEKDRTDIEEALSLEPDMLIHMTHASKNDISMTADTGISVVICPRSNFTTGVGMSPLCDMLEAGIKVGVGTDNVMLNSTNMFAEMEFLSKVFGLDNRQVFKMCTLYGSQILGLDGLGSIEKGNKAHLMILNGNSNNLSNIQDPLNGIVRRARPDDILSIIRA